MIKLFHLSGMERIYQSKLLMSRLYKLGLVLEIDNLSLLKLSEASNSLKLRKIRIASYFGCRNHRTDTDLLKLALICAES